MATLSAQSSFSQLFDQDDPEFLEALRTAVLPGDVPEDLQISSAQKQQLEKLSQEIAKKLSKGSSRLEDPIDDEDEAHRRKRVKLEHGNTEFGSAKDSSSSDTRLQTIALSNEILESNSVIDLVPEAGPSSQPRSPSKDNKQTLFKPATGSSVPLYTSDPATFADAARVPGYAPNTANAHAERLMQNAEFRAAHTSAAGADFIDGFYKNSRLHHLSMWKAELKQLVAEAQERAEKAFAIGDGDEGKLVGGLDVVENEAEGPLCVGKVKSESSTSMRGNALELLRSPSKNKGKGKAKEDDQTDTDTVIMHCDFDCFFASVGILDRPYLKNSPVVVCHSQGQGGGESSTSEVASANYKAREFGIRNGMSLRQARTLCPSVVTVPYEFEKYKKISLQLYTILMSHSDDLQAVSVDEALIDVTTGVKQMPVSSHSRNYDPAIAFAEMLRSKIREKTKCEVSIGVSHNIMLARLATRKAKPAGSFHLKLSDLQKFINNMQIEELHGFGPAIREKTQEKLGVTTLGELSRKPKSVLCDALGKTTGETLYNAMRGVDNRKLESDKPRKSVSAEINYGIRFENNEQARAFMFQLSQEVSRRLDGIEMRGRSLTLKIMKRDPDAPVEPPKFLGHGCCNIYNKQATITSPDGRATSDALVIGQHAWGLLKNFAFDPKELRGIGIQVQKLEKASDTRSDGLGQSKLGFQKLKKSSSPSKASTSKAVEDDEDAPHIVVHQPSSQDDEEIQEIPPPESDNPASASNLFLPSFSQVDRTAFEALPSDIRDEIKQEYHRRSASPALSAISDGASSLSPSKIRTTSKGTPLSRITQALAPRSRSSLSNVKHNIFEKCQGRKPQVEVTREELRRLGIDPLVFMELPKELQLEQLASARFTKSFGKFKSSKA